MCGIFGVAGHSEAIATTIYGIHGLQHRGQESAGIAYVEGENLKTITGMGLVSQVLMKEEVLKKKASFCIGHTRYSTAGSSTAVNAQPIKAITHKGPIALAHNGNLVNAHEKKQEMKAQGSIFSGDSDTEVILHLFARSECTTPEDALLDALSQVKGAYSLLALLPGRIIAVRDPNGFRPLVIGKYEGIYCFSSEPSALRLVGAEPLREVEPGEMVIASCGTLRVVPWRLNQPSYFCLFEYVYFARPDSVLGGVNVAYARRAMGRQLAREQPAKADLVIPVPDSGFYAAMGYAEESQIPFDNGLIRSHYVGRTFIQPHQAMRANQVRLKLAPIPSILQGKRVVLVDDSIVRGTTMRAIVGLLKEGGAREVHVRIASPPIRHSCFYGIDTPTSEELIAHRMDVPSIGKFMGADSLGYLSLTGMIQSIGKASPFCTACWDGHYPVGFDKPAQPGLFRKGGQTHE